MVVDDVCVGCVYFRSGVCCKGLNGYCRLREKV